MDGALARALAHVRELSVSGVPDAELQGQLVGEALARRRALHPNRCTRCWHDVAQRCICERLPTLSLEVHARVLVLMDQSEYLKPGDDAKARPPVRLATRAA